MARYRTVCGTTNPRNCSEPSSVVERLEVMELILMPTRQAVESCGPPMAYGFPLRRLWMTTAFHKSSPSVSLHALDQCTNGAIQAQSAS